METSSPGRKNYLRAFVATVDGLVFIQDPMTMNAGYPAQKKSMLLADLWMAFESRYDQRSGSWVRIFE